MELNNSDKIQSRKSRLAPIFILLATAAALLTASVVRLNFEIFPKIDVSGMEENSSELRFCIDSTAPDGKYLYIVGWAVDQEPLRYANCRVALRSLTDGTTRQMKTVAQTRGDLPEALSLEGAQWGGFQACVSLRKLDPEAQYQVLLIYRNNGKNILQDTGIFIDGQGGRIDG